MADALPFSYINEFDNLADAICTDVAELPDRSSPEDYPDHMIVTADELAGIIHRRLSQNPTFQARVASWMLECFTPAIAADLIERNDRFIEEALELVQSLGYHRDRAHALVDYVFDRPVGEAFQEVGGVMVTLAALCQPNGINMQEAAETEVERISAPDIIAKIRAKQAAKPTGSALPLPPAPPLPNHYERGQRDLLNLLLTPNKAAADTVAEIMDRDPATNPHGKLSFETLVWITTIAVQLGIEPKDNDGGAS